MDLIRINQTLTEQVPQRRERILRIDTLSLDQVKSFIRAKNVILWGDNIVTDGDGLNKAAIRLKNELELLWEFSEKLAS